MIDRLNRAAARSACAAAMLLLAASGQAQDRKGSSFATRAAPAAAGEAVQSARANSAMLKLDVRPVSAVTLAEAVPADIAVQFGAKADFAFDTALKLYGWPERPGLYCDLLRARGLGLSAACLNDRDQDGRFDEGLRLDFNSGHADLLGLTPSHKIIGVNFTKARVPLPRPIAYAPATPAADATGKLALRWKPYKAGGAGAVQMWLSTPDNYTGTEGLSENVLVFDRDKLPADIDLYGVRLRVHGFDESNAMQFSLLGIADGVPVPLLFRGYVFHIIGY